MLLEAKNISVVKGANTILDKLDFSLEQGQRVLIKGASGSGKSTLARALLFFEHLGSGSIFFNTKQICEEDLRAYRENFAYMGQVVSCFGGLGIDFVKFPFSFPANRRACPGREKINEYLDCFDLGTDVLNLPFMDLSGGQKQRLSLIRCLLLDRKILLIDEATSGLDEQNLDRVIAHICSLEHKTLLTVSHSSRWQAWCDRVLVLENGKLKAEV